jgi:carboxymethylenebutenolidase
VFGFCLGGSVAFFAAARFEPDFAVSYYGSAVPDAVGMANDITCPILFHFGGADSYIPREAVDRARRALETRDNVEFHVHEGAGHAFDNRAPMFHNAEAAAAAWRLTTDFLTRRIPATA